MSTIKAYGITEFGGAEHLKLVEIPKPVPEERDLLVRIHAVAVNPIDTKVRKGGITKIENILIVGWDAAGVVEQVGSGVTLFKVGDEVYFAGSLIRPGCNSEFTLVDERITGKKAQNFII